MATGFRRGEAVAATLAGAWRSSPPPLALSTRTLSALTPCLLGTGEAGLAWRRVRRSHECRSAPARRLHDAYRQHVLQTVVHEHHLAQVVPLLRAAGVEPLVVKGWSIARLYPEPGLRPPGDIDLCVRPGQLARALTVLTANADRCGPVDLHQGVADLADRTWEAVVRRSRLARLGDVEVRILGPEDQLRHLCLHLVRHGAWRPLWLCDVGAALEALPPDFDWDYCLHGDRSLTDWVVCAVRLACQLLDARVKALRMPGRADDLPPWLAGTVLGLWALGAQGSDVVPQGLASCPRTWAALSEALRRRWPNPIRAAFSLGLSPFTRLPRRLIQLGAFLNRAAQYAGSLLRTSRNRAPGLRPPFELHPLHVR